MPFAGELLFHEKRCQDMEVEHTARRCMDAELFKKLISMIEGKKPLLTVQAAMRHLLIVLSAVQGMTADPRCLRLPVLWRLYLHSCLSLATGSADIHLTLAKKVRLLLSPAPTRRVLAPI